MKRNKLFIGLILFALCFVIIPIKNPVNATSIKENFNFVYYPNNKDMNYYDIPISSSDEITNIRVINNTDPSITKIKIEEAGEFIITAKLLKPGNTTITLEIITTEYSDEGELIECNEEKFIHINSVKYICPIKKIKIGQKEYTSKFKNSPYYKIKNSNSIKNKKLTIKPIRDWKIKEIKLEYIKGWGIMQKTLRNNKCFSSPKTGEITIIIYNKKLDITEKLYLDL